MMNTMVKRSVMADTPYERDRDEGRLDSHVEFYEQNTDADQNGRTATTSCVVGPELITGVKSHPVKSTSTRSD